MYALIGYVINITLSNMVLVNSYTILQDDAASKGQ
jgi:hypothetical protein